MTSAPVVVESGLLPEAVPETNLRAATHRSLAEVVKKNAGGDSTFEQHQFRVAQATAAKFGPELQGSAVHEVGVFAAKDFTDACAGLPIEGSFIVYDTREQLLNAVMEGGVPRYVMCGSDSLRKMCAGHELVRDGATRTLKPDRSCPWYYRNSSFVADGGTAKLDNAIEKYLIVDRKLRSGDNVREILADAINGVVVVVKNGVKEGDGVVFWLPLRF